jgi:hypothetical protein
MFSSSDENANYSQLERFGSGHLPPLVDAGRSRLKPACGAGFSKAASVSPGCGRRLRRWDGPDGSDNVPDTACGCYAIPCAVTKSWTSPRVLVEIERHLESVWDDGGNMTSTDESQDAETARRVRAAEKRCRIVTRSDA